MIYFVKILKSFFKNNISLFSIKRKLKKYEEGFEREFGYKPSHADKMANPDTRKMCSVLSKLRKQLKCKIMSYFYRILPPRLKYCPITVLFFHYSCKRRVNQTN